VTNDTHHAITTNVDLSQFRQMSPYFLTPYRTPAMSALHATHHP